MSNQKIRKKWIGISIVVMILLLLSSKELCYKVNEVKKNSGVLELYYDFLKNKEYQKDFYIPQQVRYALVYLDEDDIPELLLAEGDSHADRIAVYYYDFEIEKVTFLSSFSSFGKISYIPKKSTVISSYGNHGYYHFVYSVIEDGEVHLKEIFLQVGNLTETTYYYGIPVQEGVTGGFQTATEETGYVMNAFPEADEMYRITEKEYLERMEQLQLGSVSVRYNDMKELEW